MGKQEREKYEKKGRERVKVNEVCYWVEIMVAVFFRRRVAWRRTMLVSEFADEKMVL